MQSGSVVLLRQHVPEAPPVEVTHLGPGDVFGEAGLLGEPDSHARSVTARAVGVVTVLEVARSVFEAMVGPAEALLRRDAEAYKRYAVLKV